MVAFEVKEKKFVVGEVAFFYEELYEKVIDVFWLIRGWSVLDGVVVVILVDIGKVLDVVYLSSICVECMKMEEKKVGSMSRLDWYRWFEKYEFNCFLNYDGSVAVRLK